MNDAEFQKLLNAEPPLVLKSNKYEGMVLTLFFIGVTVLLFLVIAQRNNPLTWFVAMLPAIFGIRAIFYPNYAYPLHLILGKDSFSVETASPGKVKFGTLRNFQSDHINWKTVSAFKVMVTGTGPSRVWYEDNTKTNPNRFYRQRFGGDYNLGNNYGLCVDQLAQLMNHWRERALANQNA